ncbi:RDD family protein [Curtobacterium sp. MCJR17_055]|uniref:RDD family protein n=1 Tax=unclassified Curtobacterium TaxID=257496 RepID=UPI000D93DC76|nr:MULTISPECIES: RDD family protein [unclassified Curtobacterium]PYY33072.1 RDD family protein [Curtobacterium sp. MCBD17_029]PYY53872.1 RDD family protein [Curtobacterium sp. MCJR17_055]PYY59240.1 RDD family protein [Curtobacterium sp. MCPF17_015]
MARSTPSTPPAAGSGRTEWPGKVLGLPESGPRSMGSFGRRFLGLVIDWALASLVSLVIGTYGAAGNFITLGIFAVLQVLFIALASGSFGHLCVGLRVVPIRGGYVGVWRPAVRAVLLCIVVPALIHAKDGRPLHDGAAGTVLVRR